MAEIVRSVQKERVNAMTEEQRMKRNEASKRYREAHPDRVKEYRRKRYEANRESELAACKKWRAAHPEQWATYLQEWKAAHPDKVREYGRRTRQRRKQDG